MMHASLLSCQLSLLLHFYPHQQHPHQHQQHQHHQEVEPTQQQQLPQGLQTQPHSQPQARDRNGVPSSELIVAPPQPKVSALPPLSATALGLPVYSATGFDALSILARVFNRPYPRIHLGPVDLTCSFVVVDTRRHDHPIVYCSPSFTKLTGYTEQEILGRNCRFLQSPTGRMGVGDPRPDPESQAASAHFKKNLTADKECQGTFVNYRKDGTPFRNLVTVIPIPGGVSGGEHGGERRRLSCGVPGGSDGAAEEDYGECDEGELCC
ncbi:hypothetical protein NMY22_g1596 [Coprinellus aureogranulatus]|nr:hypothetical protein NMY22_g1596 [Coprinellus aureogranulatus]